MSKRSKKKRKAKPAEPQETIPVQILEPAEEAASTAAGEPLILPEPVETPFEIEVEVEEFVSRVEALPERERASSPVEIPPVEVPTVAIQKEPENLHSAAGIRPDSCNGESQEKVRSAPNKADRRAHPRYAFTAAVEVISGEPGARIKTRIRDLSQQGCYVDTEHPFALGTETEVRIDRGAKSFEARARVVSNQPGRGMGLMFTGVEHSHLEILDAWISESRETSWLAANRRRSQRVLMKIPVRVSGRTGEKAFHEETHTLAVSAHGASLVVAKTVTRGERFTLLNLHTNETLECVVAHIGIFPGEATQVGVEFMLPNPTFWRVAFPPKDWTPRHPDAKSR
jgi:PilZ domain